ncbi:AMP-binding protein [Cellulomonas dongxiuzhuiae]|uniref:AMP-binding protein n=1 Tax=Cellulomonas dongxiuzhuiae TaxID=2819979 RepID=UPI001AAF5677|nr:hypothetical protein [Cellulomonas dongxiuzhuiae]
MLHLGATCAPDLKRRFLDWVGPQRVVEVYAGSESNGLTMIRGDEWLTRPGSVGRPVGGTQVRVLRDDGARRTGGGRPGPRAAPCGALRPRVRRPGRRVRAAGGRRRRHGRGRRRRRRPGRPPTSTRCSAAAEATPGVVCGE